jgi:hypothetical protein
LCGEGSKSAEHRDRERAADRTDVSVRSCGTVAESSTTGLPPRFQKTVRSGELRTPAETEVAAG